MILLGIILFFTILEAIHEGLALQGKGTIAGVVEFVKLAGLTAIVAFMPMIVLNDLELSDYYINPHKWHFWRFFLPEFVIGWICIRYALFDGIHNLAGKLKLYHKGTVKFYDRWITKLFKNQYPGPSFWVPRIVLFMLGVGLILQL